MGGSIRRDRQVAKDWMSDMINSGYEGPNVKARTYAHLMRHATQMFEPEQLEVLAPRLRVKPGHRGVDLAVSQNGGSALKMDPISATEALAYDFLAKGGKHSRPFITLAVYDALCGGLGTQADGAAHVAQYSLAVQRTAMSIETFHKASLVHDDIEDDDEFRYGELTLHRRYGTPTAINVGDYLIGLGYRLISRSAAEMGAQAANDILHRLAEAHIRLSEGQGAELLWRDAHDKRLKPVDALRIYALKTAPAFEAALLAGVRLAGPVDDYAESLGRFARHLGIAFQILNDLGDWDGDRDNKLSAAGDILGGRPTILWALALEGLDDAGGAELEHLVQPANTGPEQIRRVRQLYERAGVFAQAMQLVEQHAQDAESAAQETQSEDLRRLLRYLIAKVLARSNPTESDPVLVTMSEQSPAGTVAS